MPHSYKRFYSSLIWVLVTLLMVGCQGTYRGFLRPVGPDYCTPPATVADEWTSIDSGMSAEIPDLTQWWSVFEDPDLEFLIDTTRSQNLELRAAAARVAEARALLRISRGTLMPQLQEAFGGYSREANSVNQVTRNNNIQFFDLWETGFNASWELDFWGRFRRGIEAAEGELFAASYGRDDVYVLLLGDVASNYVRYRVAEARLQFARENVQQQQRAFDNAQARFKAGLASELDPAQAESNLAQTEAIIPLLVTEQRQALNALCVLIGQPPHHIEEAFTSRALPRAPSEIAVGIPAELLRRRPDVRQAERELAAQSARIGVAASELYPHLSVNGVIGVSANNLSDLFASNSLTGLVGPSFRWNILNYGRIRGAIDAERARFQQLCLGYQNSVLNAALEVEDNLVAFTQSQQRAASLARSVEASQRSVALGFQQYEVGETDFDRIFNLQRTLTRQQDQLAAVRGIELESLIRIYTALGGGWVCRCSLPQHTLASSGVSSIDR